jgi:hypothetical protein
METYYAVCAGLATLSLLIGMIFLSMSAYELAKTAKSVRRLADHVDERVEAFRSIGDIIYHFSQSVQSGWMRGAEVAFGLVSALKQTFSPGDGGTEPEMEREGGPHVG